MSNCKYQMYVPNGLRYLVHKAENLEAIQAWLDEYNDDTLSYEVAQRMEHPCLIAYENFKCEITIIPFQFGDYLMRPNSRGRIMAYALSEEAFKRMFHKVEEN